MNTFSKYHSRWEVAFDNQTQHVVIKRPKPAGLYIMTALVIISAILVAAIGFFSGGGTGPSVMINQYGETVELFGKGIYAADSFFRAPIFRGTDLGILVLAVPLLIWSLLNDIKSTSLASRMMLISSLFVMVYYSANVAFGIHYNALHLLYIVFFSASLFSFIVAIMNVDAEEIETKMEGPLHLKGIFVFLVLTGAALSIAWLPGIFQSVLAARPLSHIEHYTTEVTNVIDLGVIAPAVFLVYYFIRNGKPLGYILLDVLLTLCIVIGFILPLQTVFQLRAGIELPLEMIITKVAAFCILAVLAVYFKLRLMKAVSEK